MNAQELKALIDGLDLGGLTGREAMRFIGQACIMSLLEHRGAAKLLAARLGFANSGVLSVATADMGWRAANARSNNDGNKTVKTAKNVKTSGGCLPAKTSAAIAFVLNLNPAEDDIGWEQYKSAVAIQGADWVSHLFTRLGGRDSEGGSDFAAWIESNLSQDRKIDAMKKSSTMLKVIPSLVHAIDNADACFALALSRIMTEHGYDAPGSFLRYMRIVNRK